MSDWKVHDIVQILLKDEALLQARKRFVRLLNIQGDRLKEFEDDYNLHNDLYSYFCDVLEKWKSVNGNKATILLLTNILRENEFVASADRMKSSYNCNSALNLKFGVKNSLFNFVNRGKEIKQLNELFTENKSSAVLISGLEGKGKTELCRRFIQQLPKDIGPLVTWFSGDGPQQLQQSISEIAQEMKIPTKDSAEKPLSVEKLIKNISSKSMSNWVVIIDNVDKAFPDFSTAVDTLLKNGAFVVITSRKTVIQTDRHLILEELKDDAWQWVRSSLDKFPSQKSVEKLCIILQNYPLALQQAIAFIKYNQSVEDDGYGIEEYLKELMKTSIVFDHKIHLNPYEQTLSRVFELTLNKIISSTQTQLNFPQRLKYFFNSEDKTSFAYNLLKILSLVQSDGIEIDFLKELFSFFEIKYLFVSSITILKSLSLIEVNHEEVSVQPIVQKLTRNAMKCENKLYLVIDKLLENIEVNKLTKKEVTQVIQIWKNALPESEILKKNSSFAFEISKRLFDLSLYKDMKDFSEITFQQFVTALGPDHIDTLRMQYWFALALKQNDEYEGALFKFKVVWAKQKKVLGDKHWQTLNSADEIGNVLRRLEKLDESLEWHERVLKSKVKVHGESHQNTMDTKNNMALVFKAQGKIEEALSNHKQILDWKEKEIGHEHPETLDTRHNIAICLHCQRKFLEAKKELEEVLRLRIKVQGEDHVNTLLTKSCLSQTLNSMEEEALQVIQLVLISRETFF